MSEAICKPGIIRAPRPDEAAELTQLCLSSKASLGYDDDFMAQCVEELTITPERIGRGGLWVYDDGEVAGIAALTPDADGQSGEVATFFIAADRRGQGIGRILWRHILERAKQKNLTRLHLESEPLSKGFYEALGFHQTGEAPSGSIPGRFLPVMELALDR